MEILILEYSVKEFCKKLHQQVIASKVIPLLNPALPPKTKNKKVSASLLYKMELQPLLHIVFASINYLITLMAFPDFVPG